MKPRPSRLEKQVQERKKVLAMSTPVLVRKLVRTRIAELRDH
jgi:hypothetical protein